MRRLFLLGLLSVVPISAEEPALTTADGPVVVRTWGYQLQGQRGAGLDAAALSIASHDLLVVEPNASGEEGAPFSVDDVRTMQRRADCGRRVVAAYLSIGEVEEFRAVWRREWTRTGRARGKLTERAPAWLGPVNPDWPESRKVRYWDPAWRATLIDGDRGGALDKIVAQGFDAAYLDIVDAYYFWGAEAKPRDRRPGDPATEQEAARRMARLVVALGAQARQTNPAFFLVPQNGEFLLSDLRNGPDPQPEDAALAAAFLDSIGAIGVEDLYHPGDADEDNPPDPDPERVAVLNRDFLGRGKPVLVVDYLRRSDYAEAFLEQAQRDGFVPYVAPSRALDRLGPRAKGE